MKGLILVYKAKDNYSRVLFNHTLFGRLVYNNQRGKITAYYTKGLLDNVLYKRLSKGSVFISSINPEEDIKKYNDILSLFGNMEYRVEEISEECETARTYWEKIAKSRSCIFKV
jgi:hypothetical protein